jgi:hypothetical protein
MGIMKYFTEVVIYSLAEGLLMEEIKQELLNAARNHQILSITIQTVDAHLKEILSEILENPQIIVPYIDMEEQQQEVLNRTKFFLTQFFHSSKIEEEEEKNKDLNTDFENELNNMYNNNNNIVIIDNAFSLQLMRKFPFKCGMCGCLFNPSSPQQNQIPIEELEWVAGDIVRCSLCLTLNRIQEPSIKPNKLQISKTSAQKTQVK